MSKVCNEIRCQECGSNDIIRKRRRIRRGEPVTEYQCKKCHRYFTFPPKKHDILTIIDNPKFTRLFYGKKENIRIAAKELGISRSKLSRIICTLRTLIPDPLEVTSKLNLPKTKTAVIDITTLITRKLKLRNGKELTINLYVIAMLDSRGTVIGWDITLTKDIHAIFRFLSKVRRWLNYDPIVVVRDRSKEESRAIKLVYPDSSHQLCCWHLLYELEKKLPDNSLSKIEINRLLRQLYGLAKRYRRNPDKIRNRVGEIVKELRKVLKTAEVWEDHCAIKFLRNLLTEEQYLTGFVEDLESRPDLQQLERFFGVIKTRINDFVPHGRLSEKMSLGEWIAYLKSIGHLIIFSYVLDRERKRAKEKAIKELKVSDFVDVGELLYVYNSKLRTAMLTGFCKSENESSDKKSREKQFHKLYQQALTDYGFKVSAPKRAHKRKRKHNKRLVLACPLDRFNMSSP